jgi:hypothetical protein
MGKKNLDKDLAIYFEVCKSDPYSNSSQPSLLFRKSNYDLNMDEILRAKLRSNKLTLDNKVSYVKVDEEAYLNRNGENMLKVIYDKLS